MNCQQLDVGRILDRGVLPVSSVFQTTSCPCASSWLQPNQGSWIIHLPPWATATVRETWRESAENHVSAWCSECGVQNLAGFGHLPFHTLAPSKLYARTPQNLHAEFRSPGAEMNPPYNPRAFKQKPKTRNWCSPAQERAGAGTHGLATTPGCSDAQWYQFLCFCYWFLI